MTARKRGAPAVRSKKLSPDVVTIREIEELSPCSGEYLACLADLVTATPLEIEVAEKVARFELSPTQFPVLLEALHPVTRQVVWSQRIETPGVLAIPALSSQFGHPVAIRATYADGRVEEHDPPPGRPTIH